MKNTILALAFTVSIAPAADLQPLLAQPDQIVLNDDFSPVIVKVKKAKTE